MVVPQTEASSDRGVIWVSSTAINIGLLKLPLNSGPKLAVGQWITCWSGLPGRSSSRGNFLCCLIIVSIFIGLRRACRFEGGGRGGGGDFEVTIWGASYKGMVPFLWERLTPQDTMKDFNLAIGGEPGWKKWLENGEGKSLYFMRLFLHYILFGQNFIG